VRLALLALLALALTGCETTAERSAKLERVALLRTHGTRRATGLSIQRRSHTVQVLSSTVLHSSEGTAVVLTLRNRSAGTVADSPLLIAVRGADRSLLYSNTASGLAHSLVATPVIAAHEQIAWVDDQVQSASAPAGATATIGEGTALAERPPQIAVSGVKLTEEAGAASATGTVRNRSGVEQRELCVYAIATRSGRTVAAGRAVLPVLTAHGSEPFQIYFIGDPKGAKLKLSAPATNG
jgi:hypothetical protein